MQTPYILQQTTTNKILLKKWNSLDAIIKAHPTFKPHLIQKNLDNMIKSAYNFCWSYYIPDPEVYKQLKYFPDFDISTYGNIKNNKTSEPVPILVNHSGYQYVVIHQNDSKSFYSKLYPSPNETWQIHLLVADTFLENKNFFPYNTNSPNSPNNTQLVYHKDGDKSNNAASNLTFERPAHLPVKVNQIDLTTCKIIKTFPSIKHAVVSISGITENSITNACTGRCNSVKGFAWEFVYD